MCADALVDALVEAHTFLDMRAFAVTADASSRTTSHSTYREASATAAQTPGHIRA
jgi:hypothetical protein